MDFIEKLLGIYVVSIIEESKRLVELKALSAYLDMIKGVRKITLFYYISFVCLVIFCIGVYLVITEFVRQSVEYGFFEYNIVFTIGSVFIVFGAGFSIWALKESHWLSFFNADQYIASIQRKEKKNAVEDEISPAIESMLEENLERIIIDFIQKQNIENKSDIDKNEFRAKEPERSSA